MPPSCRVRARAGFSALAALTVVPFLATVGSSAASAAVTRAPSAAVVSPAATSSGPLAAASGPARSIPELRTDDRPLGDDQRTPP
ncbi:MAG TPA: hypothetical protein VMY34_01210, partial [Acidimicrobiales bacterium]|nr:hypothetical protein [Acidimicrobiales bacterium]